MTARVRTALLAVFASVGLVSVAWGAGGAVGGGASSNDSAAPAKSAAPASTWYVQDEQGQRPRHKCHRHDGAMPKPEQQGSGGGDTSYSY
jgi:hypothetical protein